MKTPEKLYPSQREAIQKAFNSKVYDQYGSREVAGIATECRSGRMHQFTDMAYLESIPGQQAGEPDYFVITGFFNKSMPIVRYKNDDRGNLLSDRCDCGLDFPLIRMDIGRTTDNFRLKSGKVVHGEYFTHLMYGLDGVERFQFRQHDYENVELTVVRNAAFSSDDQEKLDVAVAKIKRDFENELKLSVRITQEIPLTSSGKHRL